MHFKITSQEIILLCCYNFICFLVEKKVQKVENKLIIKGTSRHDTVCIYVEELFFKGESVEPFRATT